MPLGMSWPHLAERGLSEALGDLNKMLDYDIPDKQAEIAQQAIDAINKLYDLSTYRDGFRYWIEED